MRFNSKIVLAALIVTMSCGTEKDSVMPVNEAQSVTELPQKAHDIINAQYPKSTVESISLTQNSNGGGNVYSVALNSQVTLFFNEAGDLEGFKDQDDSDEFYVHPDSLDSYIIETINNVYPQATITEAEINFNSQGDISSYEIELSNGVEIYLNATGDIIFIDQEDDNSEAYEESVEIDIPVADLPENIVTIISNEYPTAQIVEAEQETLSNGTIIYEIELNNGWEYEITAEGDILEKEYEAENDQSNDGTSLDSTEGVADLPQAIMDVLDSEFPEASIIDYDLELSGAESSIFEVTLSNGWEYKLDVYGNIISKEIQNDEEADFTDNDAETSDVDSSSSSDEINNIDGEEVSDIENDTDSSAEDGNETSDEVSENPSDLDDDDYNDEDEISNEGEETNTQDSSLIESEEESNDSDDEDSYSEENDEIEVGSDDDLNEDNNEINDQDSTTDEEGGNDEDDDEEDEDHDENDNDVDEHHDNQG